MNRFRHSIFILVPSFEMLTSDTSTTTGLRQFLLPMIFMNVFDLVTELCSSKRLRMVRHSSRQLKTFQKITKCLSGTMVIFPLWRKGWERSQHAWTKPMRVKTRSPRSSAILAIAAALVIWECCAANRLLNPVILPTPLEVIHALVVVVTTPREFNSVRATAVRAIEGVVLSLAIGLPTELLLSYYRKAFDFLDWGIELIRAIPPAVVLPLFFFASSQGGADNDSAPLRLVCFGCLPILLMQITETARKVPNERLEFTKLIGANSIF